MRNLVSKGDAILEGRKEGESKFFLKMVSFFKNEENPKAIILPLDLELMEKSCLYYQNRNHIEDQFLEPNWREKAREWGSPLFKTKVPAGEVFLGPSPRDYWNSHIEELLNALDFYKRALQFSGPDFSVPKKIETVAWPTCRPAEILLAYRTYMIQTEAYVLRRYQKETKSEITGLTPVQLRSVSLSLIKKGQFSDVQPNDYLESLLRQVLLTGMRNFSPKEVDSIYERILYFVSNSESEYLKFRFRRGELFLQLGKKEPEYLPKAVLEFRESANIDRALQNEDANFPLLLVHKFESGLRLAQSLAAMGNYKKALFELDQLASQMRNVDERSVGGEKRDLVDDYRETKRVVLRKLNRFEEADELPFRN